MKTLFLVLISSLLLIGSKPVSRHHFAEPVATCYGNSPCNACKNCTYCKYCGNGGTCGICAPKTVKSLTKTAKTTVTLRKPVTKPSKPTVVSQCKGITQKGARCKRSAGSNGYCWQHGR